MPCRKVILDHKETEVPNEGQLIERFKKAASGQDGMSRITHDGLAALIAAQGIIEAIDRLRESMEKHAHADRMQTRYLSGQ